MSSRNLPSENNIPSGKKYVLRIAFCKAWQIDAELQHFLVNERGFTSAALGDYYAHCADDSYQVIKRNRFEAMYREVVDGDA